MRSIEFFIIQHSLRFDGEKLSIEYNEFDFLIKLEHQQNRLLVRRTDCIDVGHFSLRIYKHKIEHIELDK